MLQLNDSAMVLSFGEAHPQIRLHRSWWTLCRESQPLTETGRESGFCGGRIDDQSDFRDTVCREASLLRMFTNGLFVWSDLDAINHTGYHIAVQPLALRSQTMEDFVEFLRDGEELLGRGIANSGNVALDDELGRVLRSSFEDGMIAAEP